VARRNYGHWLLYGSAAAGPEMNVTDEIKARIDAVEFISRYVPLQRAGRSYKARCPFHEERTPSFVVFPESGTWRCFGACSTGGDLFSFLMQKENMDFREALQTLAQEAGVQLPEQADAGKRQEHDLLFELNAQAAVFYRDQLHRSQEAQAARDYLQQRGINSQVAAQFQLGFAPDSWEALRDHLVESGYSLDTLHRADLVKHNQERDSFYDSFRNRLIVPIHDRQGRIIGFGGRVLDDSLPKYLNTAETPLFHKSYVVYGLDRAYNAIREADCVVIVEGYMDVIAAHQFGFRNVVACLGTALTAEQLSQLNRYTDNFILALDADTAGQQATLRGLNQARQALKRKAKPAFTSTGRMYLEHRLSANLRIAELPEGRDPDDIIRQNIDDWQRVVDRAEPLINYYRKIVDDLYDLNGARGRAEAVDELTPLIAELDDDKQRQRHTEWLRELLGFPIYDRTIEQRVHTVSYALNNPPSASNRRWRYTQPPSDRTTEGMGPQTAPDATTSRERVGGPGFGSQAGDISPPRDMTASELEGFLLSLLIYDPDLMIWLKDEAQALEVEPLCSNDFQKSEYREIFGALSGFIAGDEFWNIEIFQEGLNPSYHSILSRLMTQFTAMPEKEPEDIRHEIRKLLLRLRDTRQRENLSEIQTLLHDAQESKDSETIREFSPIINTIRRDRNHLERVMMRMSQVTYGAVRTEMGLVIAPESPQ